MRFGQIDIRGNTISSVISGNIAVDVPSRVGQVGLFFTATAPQGIVYADRSAISRTVYNKLWSYVVNNSGDVFDPSGTEIGKYGPGDGSTTFTLPDYRGLFPRAAGVNGTKQKANSQYFSGGVPGATSNDKLQRFTITDQYGINNPLVVNFGAQQDVFIGTYSSTQRNPSATGGDSSVRTGDETAPASFSANFGIFFE